MKPNGKKPAGKKKVEENQDLEKWGMNAVTSQLPGGRLSSFRRPTKPRAAGIKPKAPPPNPGPNTPGHNMYKEETKKAAMSMGGKTGTLPRMPKAPKPQGSGGMGGATMPKPPMPKMPAAPKPPKMPGMHMGKDEVKETEDKGTKVKVEMKKEEMEKAMHNRKLRPRYVYSKKRFPKPKLAGVRKTEITEEVRELIKSEVMDEHRPMYHKMEDLVKTSPLLALAALPISKKVKEVMQKGYEGFAAVKASAAKSGASNPGAVAAAIGRKKYGKKKFQQAAAEGHKMKGMHHKSVMDEGSKEHEDYEKKKAKEIKDDASDILNVHKKELDKCNYKAEPMNKDEIWEEFTPKWYKQAKGTDSVNQPRPKPEQFNEAGSGGEITKEKPVSKAALPANKEIKPADLKA